MNGFGSPLAPRVRRARNIKERRLQAREFNKALSDWAIKAVPEDVVKVTKFFAFEALRRIVKRTPVDTGRARGGWQVTLTVPAEGQSSNTDGKGVVAAGRSVMKAAKPFQVIWISNNVEYIRILEEGGFEPPSPGPSKTGGSSSARGRKARKGKVLVQNGFSTQAPQGMVGITLQELKASGVIK